MLLFCSFLVPRKVRFLAMTMLKQDWLCSCGLTKTFFSRSSKTAFSRHDNAQASLALLMWLNENVGKEGFEKTQSLTEFMSVVSLTK